MNGRAQYKCKHCKKHSLDNTNDKGLFILFCEKAKHTIKSLGANGEKSYKVSPKWCPYKNNPIKGEWRLKGFVK